MRHERNRAANANVNRIINGTTLAIRSGGEGTMSVVRLLGFATLPCGCVVGRYRELATSREVVYVEEKGPGCTSHLHRRNHTLVSPSLARSRPAAGEARAS
jgi:hypothetical protein